MSEWLTGTQVDNIRSYFDPEQESSDICEVAESLLKDRERMVGLIRDLTQIVEEGEDYPYYAEKARACLKAQGE